MIHTPLTIKVLKITYEAHHGQTDTSRVPYVFHPYHLAEQMTDEFSTDYYDYIRAIIKRHSIF